MSIRVLPVHMATNVVTIVPVRMAGSARMKRGRVSVHLGGLVPTVKKFVQQDFTVLTVIKSVTARTKPSAGKMMDNAFVILVGWAIDATMCVRKDSTGTIVWNRVTVHLETMPAMRPEDAFAAWDIMEKNVINLARKLKSRRRKILRMPALRGVWY